MTAVKEKLNCPNCGAPITGYKCDYCGTQFFDFADIEINKKGYLRIKIDGRILIFEAFPQSISITNVYQQFSEMNIDFVLFQVKAEAIK